MGSFPEVEITACQVAAFKHPCSKELRRLQSTPRTQVKRMGAAALVVAPCAAVLTEDSEALMAAPLVSCFQGIVSRVESLIRTHEDVPMQEIGVTMANGYEVPVMLYDAQTEEEVQTKDAVAVWFGEHRAGLRDRADSKGNGVGVQLELFIEPRCNREDAKRKAFEHWRQRRRSIRGSGRRVPLVSHGQRTRAEHRSARAGRASLRRRSVVTT